MNLVSGIYIRVPVWFDSIKLGLFPNLPGFRFSGTPDFITMIGLASVMYGVLNLSVSKRDQLSEKEVKMNVFGLNAMNIFFMTLAVIGIVLMLVFEMESSVYKHGIIVLHLFILQTVLNFVCITCQCIFGCTLPCKITGSRPGSNSNHKHLCKNCHQNCDHIHQHV